MSIYLLSQEDLEFFESLKTFVLPEELSQPTLSSSGEYNSFYGHKHTEETKLILSEWASMRIGDLNPNYKNYWSDEQKQRMSDIHKGKTLSDEHKFKLSLAFSGKNNHQYGKTGELSPNYGRIVSEETKEKISKSLTGRILPENQRIKMSNAKNNIKGDAHPNFGKKYNMSSITCIHCGKSGSQNMKRYHFENCKYKI